MIAACALTTSTCGKDDDVPTLVRVVVTLPAGVPVDHLSIGWLSADRGLVGPTRFPADRPIAAGAAIARIQIEVTEQDPVLRRLVVTARSAADDVLAWSAIERTIPPKQWSELIVTLTTAPWMDADNDGVPNELDRCPSNDYTGCGGPPGADAAVP